GEGTVRSPRLDQKRIALTLHAECAHGAMTADEGDVVPERKQLRFDGTDQRIVIAIREGRPPDGAANDDNADEHEPVRPIDVDERAWRMTRAMEDLEVLPADGECLTLLHPAVGGGVAHAGEAVARRLFLGVLHQELVGNVRP